MKFKHVKEILIGTAGMLAVGGIATGVAQELHSRKAAEGELLTAVAEEETDTEQVVVEELHLEKTEQSPEQETEGEAVVMDQTEENIEQLSDKEAGEDKTAKEEAAGSVHKQDTIEAEVQTETEDKVSKQEPKKSVKKRNETSKAEQEQNGADEKKEIEETEPEEELVIATVDNYLNIRSEAGLEGEVIGKLYNHSVGVLTEEAEDGWYRITSGSVDGYVKGDYVKRGEEGAALAEEVGQRLARVDTTTLRVREEPTTESRTLGLLPDGDILEVSEEVEGWAKVSVEEGDGYVSTDYVEVYTKNTVAESKEEEEARLLREEEERRAAAEAAARELARQQAEAAARQQAASQQAASQQAASQQTAGAGQSSAGTGGNSGSQSGTSTGTQGSAGSQSGAATGSSAATGSQGAQSSLGKQIADYALQFVGNPYVYGGTSLTNGADCSGFVMSVYKHFGISLPRTSGEQGQCGSAVSGLENAREGDLIWYSGHIGIYIGNGQIVHASSPKSGIKVSNATYRNILSIRRIV